MILTYVKLAKSLPAQPVSRSLREEREHVSVLIGKVPVLWKDFTLSHSDGSSVFFLKSFPNAIYKYLRLPIKWHIHRLEIGVASVSSEPWIEGLLASLFVMVLNTQEKQFKDGKASFGL